MVSDEGIIKCKELFEFAMYFHSHFLETRQTIHFWKRYDVLSLKNNVYIFFKWSGAAILNSKMVTTN